MANTSSSSKKVLVVDDNVALAKIEERILTGQGWNVDVARHGQEALDMVKLKHDEYNVVLMDLFMPGMGGLQATKLIREFEQANQLRRLRIIALTGDSPTLNNESDQRAQSFSVGCDDFLKKPLDWKQLHSILSRNVVTTDDGSPQAYM
jgi:CheY-like chemotaxis protein